LARERNVANENSLVVLETMRQWCQGAEILAAKHKKSRNSYEGLRKSGPNFSQIYHIKDQKIVKFFKQISWINCKNIPVYIFFPYNFASSPFCLKIWQNFFYVVGNTCGNGGGGMFGSGLK
jgi:hypothetical protein